MLISSQTLTQDNAESIIDVIINLSEHDLSDTKKRPRMHRTASPSSKCNCRFRVTEKGSMKIDQGRRGAKTRTVHECTRARPLLLNLYGHDTAVFTCWREWRGKERSRRRVKLYRQAVTHDRRGRAVLAGFPVRIAKTRTVFARFYRHERRVSSPRSNYF